MSCLDRSQFLTGRADMRGAAGECLLKKGHTGETWFPR
jgi:hypothetical protein